MTPLRSELHAIVSLAVDVYAYKLVSATTWGVWRRLGRLDKMWRPVCDLIPERAFAISFATKPE